MGIRVVCLLRPDTVKIGVEEVEERVRVGGIHIRHVTANNRVTTSVKTEIREGVGEVEIALQDRRELGVSGGREHEVDLLRGHPVVRETLAEVAEDASVVLLCGTSALGDVEALILEDTVVDTVTLGSL